MKSLLKLIVFAGIGLGAPGPADQILVEEQPPLTQELLDEIIGVQERVLRVTLSARERRDIRAVLIDDWPAVGGLSMRYLKYARLGREQMGQYPERAQRIGENFLHMMGVHQLRALLEDDDASHGILLRAYRRTYPDLAPGPNECTAPFADCYVESVLIEYEALSGRTAPDLSATQRIQFRRVVAGDLARLAPTDFARIANAVQSLHMSAFIMPGLDSLDRLAIRVKLGAKLTDNEARIAARAMRLVKDRRLNYIVDDTREFQSLRRGFLPSVPYWDADTQTWVLRGQNWRQFP